MIEVWRFYLALVLLTMVGATLTFMGMHWEWHAATHIGLGIAFAAAVMDLCTEKRKWYRALSVYFVILFSALVILNLYSFFPKESNGVKKNEPVFSVQEPLQRSGLCV